MLQVTQIRPIERLGDSKIETEDQCSLSMRRRSLCALHN